MIGVRDLVIDDLRYLAAVPNGLDRQVLMRIQDTIATDVVYLYRNQLDELMGRQQLNGVPAGLAREERRQFFAEHLNAEYRSRAANGAGFSLPLYVEAAKNFYHLEIRRHLQQVQDYLAHGRAISEVHPAVDNVRELRAGDPKLNALAQKVAAGLNLINDTLERLSRVQAGAAQRVSRDLHAEMRSGLTDLKADDFTASLLSEAQMLADVRRVEEKLNDAEPSALKVR